MGRLSLFLAMFCLLGTRLLAIETKEGKDEQAEFVKVMESADLKSSRNPSPCIKTSWTNLKARRSYGLRRLMKRPAGTFRKGDVFTFKGVYDDIKQQRGGPLVIYLNTVQLIPRIIQNSGSPLSH